MIEEQWLGVCEDCGLTTWLAEAQGMALCMDCEAERVFRREAQRLDDYDYGIIEDDDR